MVTELHEAIRPLRRHALSLDEAVEIAKAGSRLGGYCNLYDMSGSEAPHWLVEIFNIPESDWTADRERSID